jgi:hypothetical protein
VASSVASGNLSLRSVERLSDAIEVDVVELLRG